MVENERPNTHREPIRAEKHIDKYHRFEQVKKNQELNEKLKKDRIGHILSRSTRKEVFREKYFKNKKQLDGLKKDTHTDRIIAAQRKV